LLGHKTHGTVFPDAFICLCSYSLRLSKISSLIWWR